MYGPQPQGPAYRPAPKKKSNVAGLWVMIGGAALLIVIIYVLVNPGSPKPTQVAPPPSEPPVNVEEAKRREIYTDICRYKAMLKSSGGTASDAYRVVARVDQVPIETVRAVEMEGIRKGWPKNLP